MNELKSFEELTQEHCSKPEGACKECPMKGKATQTETCQEAYERMQVESNNAKNGFPHTHKDFEDFSKCPECFGIALDKIRDHRVQVLEEENKRLKEENSNFMLLRSYINCSKYLQECNGIKVKCSMRWKAARYNICKIQKEMVCSG